MNGSEPGREVRSLPLHLRNGPWTTLGGVRSPAASDRPDRAGETGTCNGGGDGTGAGIAIGICLGVAIGLATDDLALWLPVGVALGAGLGAALRRRR